MVRCSSRSFHAGSRCHRSGSLTLTGTDAVENDVRRIERVLRRVIGDGGTCRHALLPVYSRPS